MNTVMVCVQQKSIVRLYSDVMLQCGVELAYNTTGLPSSYPPACTFYPLPPSPYPLSPLTDPDIQGKPDSATQPVLPTLVLHSTQPALSTHPSVLHLNSLHFHTSLWPTLPSCPLPPSVLHLSLSYIFACSAPLSILHVPLSKISL